MSTLLDLAVDLINEAKNAKDAKGKLYLLEQVKEIIFHRDKSLMKDVLPSVFEFMLEKSTPVRKFLVRFGEEAMQADADASFSLFINLVNFLLTDSNDSLLSALAKSFQKCYVILLLKIVSMPAATKAQGLNDPKQLWQLFNTIASRFNDFISSSRSDQLRINCLRLYEIELLFGLPNPTTSATADPRLARKSKDPRLARSSAAAAAGGSTADASATMTGADDGTTAPGNLATGATTGSSKTAELISLHHPFISRNEIQRAAEDKLTRALLWSSKQGPQGYPFAPTLMSILGQLMANVASSRLNSATTAAKALISMIHGKAATAAAGGSSSSSSCSPVAQEMTGVDREHLARAVHRLLRSASAYTADPEKVMPKLRAAVAALEALGLETTTGAGAGVAAESGRKRTRTSSKEASSTAGTGDQAAAATGRGGGGVGIVDDEDNEEILAERRLQAIAAIDAAESKWQVVRTGSSAGGGDVVSAAGGLSTDPDDIIGQLLGSVASSTTAATAASVAVAAAAAGGASGAFGAAGMSTGFLGILANGDTTELAKDLPPWQDPVSLSGLKLVTTTTSTTAAAAAADNAHNSDSGITPLSVPPSAEEYAELALCSLKKQLESYAVMETMSQKIFDSFCILCVKSLLSTTLTALESHQPMVPVQIISSIPATSAAGFLSADTPTRVLLPPSLWIFVGFVLTPTSSMQRDGSARTGGAAAGGGGAGGDTNAYFGNKNQQASEEIEDIQRKVSLLSKFLLAIQEELVWQHVRAKTRRSQPVAGAVEEMKGGGRNGGDGEEKMEEEKEEEDSGVLIDGLIAIYDAVCAAAMSRLIQTVSLRPALSSFLQRLPRVPPACLCLLKILMRTGSTTGGARDRLTNIGGDLSKNRGTRAEAMSALGQLVFSQDTQAGVDTLHYLLWCSISEDFELRTKVINLIVNELLHMEDWCDAIIMKFAIQSQVCVVGIDAMMAWFEKSPSTSAQYASRGEKEEMVGGGEDEEENDRMEEGTRGESEEFSLHRSFDEYDGGMSFSGEFQCVTSVDSIEDGSNGNTTNTTSSVAAQADNAKRCLQLLLQLCPVDKRVLGCLMSMYSAWEGFRIAQEEVAANRLLSSAGEGVEGKDAAAAATNADPGALTATVSAPSTSPAVWSLADTLKSEMRNILPAVLHNNTVESVFDTLAVSCDALARPLLEFALVVMLPDYSVPPSPSIIQRVRAFVDLHQQQQRQDTIEKEPSVNPQQIAGGEDAQEMTNEGETEAKMDVEEQHDTNATVADPLDGIVDPVDFRLMLPLVGGFSANTIVAHLPRMIKVLGKMTTTATGGAAVASTASAADETDGVGGLRSVFNRICKVRPPPLSKSALLVALHRIDFEAQGLEAKLVLEAISLCLNNKSEFSGEVIKDALRKMVTDDQLAPPYALMRTAILSAQSFAEVKRFVLSDVIPSLVRKRVWLSLPKLWDGVIHGARNLAATGFKNSELTLRALLGIPAKQLKGLLRAAPAVKVAMAKLLKTLSSEEKEEVTSGKWVGLVNSVESATATALEGGGEDDAAPLSEAEKAKLTADKQKIIKDIAATPTT